MPFTATRTFTDSDAYFAAIRDTHAEGVITRRHGAHVFPDSNARLAGEDPQYLYSVRFTGKELWGEEADPAIKVSIEAFEPYLSPA